MDFFTVPTASLRMLCVMFDLEHDRFPQWFQPPLRVWLVQLKDWRTVPTVIRRFLVKILRESKRAIDALSQIQELAPISTV
jgi:hypothetical protein